MFSTRVGVLFVFTVLVYKTIGVYSVLDYGGSDQIVNPSELIQHLIGEDGVLPVAVGRRQAPSSYVLLLYNALLSQDEANQGPDECDDNEFATIRTYRGIKVRRSSNNKNFAFTITNVRSTRMNRAEIVIKITRRFRNKLSAVQNITLPQSIGIDTIGLVYGDYLIFDISSLTAIFQNNLTIVNSVIMDNETVRISKRNEPLLVMYEHAPYNPLLHTGEAAIEPRSRRHIEELSNNYSGENDLYSCRRYDWIVDMNIFNLAWWIAPRSYNAGYCAGRCRFPLSFERTNSTSYSFMKNLWHSQTFFVDENVPRASCTPVEYNIPLRILYLSSNLVANIILMPNMSVKSCGCR